MRFRTIVYTAAVFIGYVTTNVALAYNAIERSELEKNAVAMEKPPADHNLESLLVAGGGVVLAGGGLYRLRKKVKGE